MLTDTGPLVALCNRKDRYHQAASVVFGRLREPMITTPACLTESLHLLYRAGGWPTQSALWILVRAGVLEVCQEPATAPLRAADYMERFRDQPCDYADATLLVAAEDNAIRQIFTIDPHFHAYRLSTGEALDVLM